MTGWRGVSGPYAGMFPGAGGGGGYKNGWPAVGRVAVIWPASGVGGGGGLVQSSGQPLAGYGGCGGPGPGALIGVRSPM